MAEVTYAYCEPEYSRRFTPRGLLPLTMVLLVALAALWPVCRAAFVRFDDQTILYKNQTLNPPTWRSLREWWTAPHQQLYTPVAYTVWGALALVDPLPRNPITGSRLNPAVFHTANLLIHLLTTSLVYLLIRRLFSLPWPAAAATLLFAIHPLQVESVAHASGIQGLLCGLFSIASLLAYIRAIEREFDWRFYLLALLAFVLAMLSKPLGMVLPLLATVVEIHLLNRPARLSLKRLWPWLLFSITCALTTRHFQPPVKYDVDVPLYNRPLIAAYALAFYLGKLIFPLHLGIGYCKTPSAIMKDATAYLTWLIPAGVGFALWERRRTLRPIVAGTLWAVAALLPVLGFVPFASQTWVSTVADRYCYLPMVGVAIAAAWILSRPAVLTHRKWAILVCVMLLTTFGVRTFAQTLVWKNTITLFENNKNVYPPTYVPPPFCEP